MKDVLIYNEMNNSVVEKEVGKDLRDIIRDFSLEKTYMELPVKEYGLYKNNLSLYGDIRGDFANMVILDEETKQAVLKVSFTVSLEAKKFVLNKITKETCMEFKPRYEGSVDIIVYSPRSYSEEDKNLAIALLKVIFNI